MKFSKVLSALMLLLISSSGFSFISAGSVSCNVDFEHPAPSELLEGSVINYDSTLSAQYNFQSLQFFPAHSNSSGFDSSHREVIANRYIRYSYLIEPGLGLQKIIFPFHSFL